MALQLTHKQTLLAKFGGVPVATDVITLSEAAFVKVTVKTGTTNCVGTGTFGNEKGYSVPDMTTAEITANATLTPTADAVTPPSLSALFRACGLVETIGASSVKYTPFSGMVDTATLINYLDGEKRTITGAVGNMTMNFAVGELAKVSFSMKGFTDAEPVIEVNPTVTLDCGNGKFIVDSVQAVTLGGAVINLESADFDLGNKIDPVYAIDKREEYISDFVPTIKIKDVKQKSVTDHWTDIKNGTLKAFLITLTSGTRTLTLSTPYCNYTDVSEGDENGKVSIDRSFRCEASAGGDNFEITYA